MDFLKIIDLCSIWVEMLLLINVWKKVPMKLIHSSHSQTSPYIRIYSFTLEVWGMRLHLIPVKPLRVKTSHPYFQSLLPRWSQVWNQWSKWVTCVEWTALVLAGSLSGMQSAGALPTPASLESDLDRGFPNFNVPSKNFGVLEMQILIQLFSQKAWEHPWFWFKTSLWEGSSWYSMSHLPGYTVITVSNITRIIIATSFFSSVQFSLSVVSDSLRHHGLQHARPPCASSTPRVYPNSCPLSQWCHPTISSSAIPFFCLQSFPESGSFQMSQLFTSGGQSTGASASTSVFPMNTQDWYPLWWTGWISLLFKGLSRVFSNSTVQKHQFFGAQLSL